MKFKYFLLLIGTIIVDILLIYKIQTNEDKSIKYEEQLVVAQADTHFKDQVKTRLWNSEYGGVYVYPKKGQGPNPYLPDNTIRDEHNRTMIKINPAWMTRQLSELQADTYHFRITGLNPLNPENTPTPFEEKALRKILQNNFSRYYKFDKENKKLQYMGALITEKACLQCHEHQGYKLGDVRGGISISLDSSIYFTNKEHIRKNHLMQKVVVVIFSIIFLFLMYKIMKYSEKLKNDKKTIENYFKIIDDNLIVCYTNTDGIITNVSKAFSEITAYKEEDCINKSNSFLMSSDTPEGIYEDLWKHIESGLKWHGELKYRKANGEYFWVSLDTSPIYDKNSKLLGYMIIYYDVTDLKQS